VIPVNTTPDGMFPRGAEPIPENLGELCRTVRETGADVGFAQDMDADRLAVVDEQGVPVGEEYTLVLAARYVLARERGAVVANLATTTALDAVARAFDCPIYRSKIGEANVTEEMRRHGAVIGGEGNGGVIAPEAHLGRDGTVAAVLVAQAWADAGGDFAAAVRSLPRYVMMKDKVDGVRDWPERAQELRTLFAECALDTTDGLRFARYRAWLHVRPSGTEPIVRLIAESPDAAATQELLARARRAFAA